MSFREKSAWIILVTLVVLSVAFGSSIAPHFTLAPAPDAGAFRLLIRMFVTFVAVVVIAHIVVAALSPRDVTSSSDEREKLIELKSTATASYVYILLSLGGGFFTLHIAEANRIGMGYMMLFAFVLAEIFNYAMRVILYRRGS